MGSKHACCCYHLGLQACARELCAEGGHGRIRRVRPGCLRLESSLQHSTASTLKFRQPTQASFKSQIVRTLPGCIP